MIVTAAVAAGVIIYTTQTLQQRALQTGAEAKERVSTGIEVERVFGYQFNGTALNNNLQKVTVVAPLIRLMAGSQPINFNDFSILLTTERGSLYAVSLATKLPVAIHGILEGGKIRITGFVYGGSIDVLNVTIDDNTTCKAINTHTTGTYLEAMGGEAPCYIGLISTNISEPLSLEESLKILEEMKDIGIELPSLLIGLAVRNSNIYLEAGELYEWRFYVKDGVYPEERYSLQIIPKGGYPTHIDGRIPTVLQAPLEDIWAK